MRSGTKVLRQVSLEGRLVETSILLKSTEIINQNYSSMEAMVIDANDFCEEKSMGKQYLWKNVPVKYILQFIERFHNHPASQLTEKKPLKGLYLFVEILGYWKMGCDSCLSLKIRTR